jgi:14-3-3 protein epsilon
MSSDRELKFFMARVADQAERYTDVLTYLDAIVGASAELNADERNLLSVAYKALTGSRRSALRTTNVLLEEETIKAIPERVAKLLELKGKLIAELDEYSTSLIQLTDAKLLPAAADATTKVFYEKLKADYYRYSVEFKADEARKAGAEKAKTAYESAMQIATAELAKADPAYLGLALNYSVFLYEIIGQKQEAIDLADKSFKEAVDSLDTISEDRYSEATIILQLLKDNVSLWNDEHASASQV